MINPTENFLHTTHRTSTWFNKTFESGELNLAPPYQRNAVWTDKQKSYLIDTILKGLPIPELYMQDTVSEDGEEQHIVVDGQQRIRAILDFMRGNLRLEGDDVARQWRSLKFEDLSGPDKKAVYNYKFVVRVLPPELQEDDIRSVFSRLNKNVVSLTDQEIRNATYWGAFITTIHKLADDPFWSDCGVFSANDHRRMLDHEFISELAIAQLHGPQNKKDRLDFYYRLYEENFDQMDALVKTFKLTTFEIERVLPELSKTRWKKKSDFYTLFLEIAGRCDKFPLESEALGATHDRVKNFGEQVDGLIRLDEQEWADADENVVSYARGVARAASDRGNRIARAKAFSAYVFGELPRYRLPEGKEDKVEAISLEVLAPLEAQGAEEVS